MRRLAIALALALASPAMADNRIVFEPGVVAPPGLRYIGTASHVLTEAEAAAKARQVFAATEADAAASNRLLFVWYNGRVDVVAFPDGAACASARASLLETTREKWGQPPVMLCVR